MRTPDWRGFSIPEIMVAENIEERCIIAISQGGKIFRGQVAAGQDQVNAGNWWTAADRFKQLFDDRIRHTEDFHKFT
jgi:hypothetical protein